MKREISVFIASSLLSVAALAQPAMVPNEVDANGKKQGKWQKLYDDGKVRYQGQFKDDIPVGMFKYYYKKGQLQATINHFDNGKRSAAHMYYPNGEYKAVGLYYEEKKDSLWKYFDEQGALISEVFYKSGEPHGVMKDYYVNGQLLQELGYKNGVKDGVWKKYYADGKERQTATYVDGKLDGEFKVYFEDGKPNIEGKYRDDVKVGNWYFYDSFGTLERVQSWVDGVMKKDQRFNGEDIKYYPSGIPKSKTTYKNGKKNGVWEEYFDVGEWKTKTVPGDPKFQTEPEEVEYLEGQQISAKGKYVNGELNGEVIHYKMDGSILSKEQYSNGVKQ